MTVEDLAKRMMNTETNIEKLAHKLFIRWITGLEDNLPGRPLTDETITLSETGPFFKLKNGGYATWRHVDCVDDKRYAYAHSYHQWLMCYCRQIAKEALSVDNSNGN